MKLDKIRFARLIAWLSVKVKFQLEINDINELDELINIEPDTRPIGVDTAQLHYLMSLMQEGTKKIEAIKVHRSLTGYGLKESKDMVEKYWPNNIVYEYSLSPSEVKAVTVFISEMRIKENG